MEASGVPPSRAALPLVLKACARLQDVELGRKIHSDISSSNLIGDVRVRTALIDFYCKCGFMDDARGLFEEMIDRDLVSWNVMICGYTGNSQYKDAISLFSRMQRVGLNPNSVTLVSLLSACAELSQLRLGQEIHCYCLRNGFFDLEAHVGTSLIGFYVRFDVGYSPSVFDMMTVKNIVSWNAAIYAYFHKGDVDAALKLFVRMLDDVVAPDSVTLLAVLQSCAEFGCLELGKQVHQLAIKYGFSSDNFVGNALINMYGKCGCSESAYEVLEKMLKRDPASWNAMLSAYKNCMCCDRAYDLFKRMLMEDIEENTITLATVLSICAQCGDFEKGKQLHAYVVKIRKDRDFTIESALLSMYVDCDCMASANIIFHEMDKLDAVMWNIFITGLIRNGMTCQAFGHFRHMQQTETAPNSYTMVSLLEGCKDRSTLSVGRSIHGYIIRNDLDFNSSLRTALTDMYMDCGYESAAVYLFWSSSVRDIVSCNAMISSYIQNGKPNEALCLFYQIMSEVKTNSSTIISVLLSCAHMANLPQGRCLHAYIIRRDLGLAFDIPLGNALLTMYAKCGSISNAEWVFRHLPGRDIISWNAMIAAYGMHGRGEDALCIFYQMLESGERPTKVTFISVLSACSHSGLITEGWDLFHSMAHDYNITPEVVHYACMVDLLGRAGSLDEASNLIHSMPVEPDASLWRALLAACRVFSNIKLARMIAEKLIELEPMNTGSYILLSNIYAAAGSWDDVKTLRAKIKEKGLKKTPGYSWMVIRNQTHPFTVGDISVI